MNREEVVTRACSVGEKMPKCDLLLAVGKLGTTVPCEACDDGLRGELGQESCNVAIEVKNSALDGLKAGYGGDQFRGGGEAEGSVGCDESLGTGSEGCGAMGSSKAECA